LLFVLAVEAESVVAAVMAASTAETISSGGFRYDVRDAELKYSCLGAG
jgi:hypothetical protein